MFDDNPPTVTDTVAVEVPAMGMVVQRSSVADACATPTQGLPATLTSISTLPLEATDGVPKSAPVMTRRSPPSGSRSTEGSMTMMLGAV